MRRMVFGIAIAIVALMQGNGMADDQQIADYIKSRLQVEQQRGNLRGFNVDMRVDRGTVWFKGHVSNETQEMLILRTAQQAGHLGVVQVVDDIEINTAKQPTVAPTTYQQSVMVPKPPRMAPVSRVAARQAPVPQQMTAPRQTPVQQSTMPNYVQGKPAQVTGAINSNVPMAFAQSKGIPTQQASSSRSIPGAISGPAPMSMGNMGMSEAPNMPGYAWPGYAAHPNYSAVTYPRQYSASAWPYIGPFYPYPQVPLGWRKVALEWDDGWWYLDFHNK